MAFDSSNLALIGSVNGFGLYRYDDTAHPDTVEAAGYMNNVDDNLNLAVGDIIHYVQWSVVRTGTISAYKAFIVTNVIDNPGNASDGNVNLAEIGVSSAGAISSGT